LTPEEVAWVNKYNKECFDKISPALKGDALAYAWIERETKAI
jgi:Xaa-Pro aminopeptidase